MKQTARTPKILYTVLLFLLAAVLLAARFGLQRAQSADFICTNGDYQNYNTLRRFLAGQIPYTEYVNYLGMGVLWTCAPLLALHNTFAGSLFVTHFVAAFGYILLAALVFYLITGNKTVSAAAGVCIPWLFTGSMADKLGPLAGAYGHICSSVSQMLAPGNSMRPVRALLPVLLCWAMLLCIRCSKKEIRDIIAGRGAATVGFVLGACLPWSNDMGFACIGSGVITVMILTAANAVQKRDCAPRHPVRQIGILLAAATAGAAVCIFAVTGGHPGSWLAYTRDVSGWQSWYYLAGNSKITDLRDLVSRSEALWWLFVYVLGMGFCLYWLCRGKAGDRMILYVFLASAFVACQLIYAVGSCASLRDYFEGVHSLAVLTFLAGGVKLIGWLMGRIHLPAIPVLPLRIAAITAAVCVAAGVFLREDLRLWQQLMQSGREQGENYLPELEGSTGHAPALKAMQALVGDEPLFAVYATALDDMRGTFQPTGADYIIHALGDERAAAYVRDFDETNYTWAQTIDPKENPWAIWNTQASWDFFRELYASYTFHSDNGAWLLWHYAAEDANVLDVPVTAELEQKDAQHTVVHVHSPEKRPCFVDVALSWDTSYIMNWRRFLTWRKMTAVCDGSSFGQQSSINGYCLRESEQEKHLMVFMENGEGSIEMRSIPENCTELTVFSVQPQSVILSQTDH